MYIYIYIYIYVCVCVCIIRNTGFERLVGEINPLSSKHLATAAATSNNCYNKRYNNTSCNTGEGLGIIQRIPESATNSRQPVNSSQSRAMRNII